MNKTLSRPKILVIEVEPSGECKKTGYREFIENGYDLFFLIAQEKYSDIYSPNVRVVKEMTNDAFINEAVDWDQEHHFDAVATLSEFSVIATSCIASKLGLRGISLQSALICRNKFFMRNSHKDGAVRHPQYHLIEDESDAVLFAEKVGFPLIIKPTLGGGSEHIYKVKNKDELIECFNKAKKGLTIHSQSFSEPYFSSKGPNGILVEEYLNGSEHSLEAWVWNGVVTIGAIGDRLSQEKNLFDNDIYTMPTRLSSEQIEDIRVLVESAAKAQGLWRCVLHPEIRYHNGQPYIVEMGARAGGGPISHMTREAYGYCAIKATFDIACGREPEQPSLQGTGRVVVAIALICEGGKIEEIYTPDDNKDFENIIYFKIFLKNGDINYRPPHGNMLLGQICASGKNLDDAFRTAETLNNKIKVKVSELPVQERSVYA